MVEPRKFMDVPTDFGMPFLNRPIQWHLPLDSNGDFEYGDRLHLIYAAAQQHILCAAVNEMLEAVVRKTLKLGPNKPVTREQQRGAVRAWIEERGQYRANAGLEPEITLNTMQHYMSGSDLITHEHVGWITLDLDNAYMPHDGKILAQLKNAERVVQVEIERRRGLFRANRGTDLNSKGSHASSP
jgi:hypothetical protein